jgi:hypothetical protein
MKRDREHADALRIVYGHKSYRVNKRRDSKAHSGKNERMAREWEDSQWNDEEQETQP